MVFQLCLVLERKFFLAIGEQQMHVRFSMPNQETEWVVERCCVTFGSRGSGKVTRTRGKYYGRGRERLTLSRSHGFFAWACDPSYTTKHMLNTHNVTVGLEKDTVSITYRKRLNLVRGTCLSESFCESLEAVRHHLHLELCFVVDDRRKCRLQ